MPAPLPQVDTEKAKFLLSVGQSQTETAKQLGVSRSTTHRIAHRCKKEIEQLTLNLIERQSKHLLNNHLNTLQLADEVIQLTKKTDNRRDYRRLRALGKKMQLTGLTAKDLLQMADKKEYRGMQITGILSTQTPSLVINQLFQQQNNYLTADSVEKLADTLNKSRAIDCEYEQIKDD